jgi:hypothetical protein
MNEEGLIKDCIDLFESYHTSLERDIKLNNLGL